MTQQSKPVVPGMEEASPQEVAMKKAEAKLVRVFGPMMFLTVISGGMLVTPRQALGQRIMPNPVELTDFFAKLASAGAFFEFLANPILGKISDRYGRKSVIAIPNFTIALCRIILFNFPEKKWPLVLEQSVSIPLVTSLFTLYRSALSDKLDGSIVAAANAKIGMGIGLSLIAGPLCAKLIMNNMDPKYCYLLSIFLASCSGTWLLTQLEETLPEEKRKPLVLGDMQPLSFLQLMRDSTLRRLMLITGMQTVSEGRNMNDAMFVFLQQDLKWDWSRINNLIALMGISLIVSGTAVGGMMKSMGLRKFTTFSNMSNIAQTVAWARLPPFSLLLSDGNLMYLGLVLSAFGGRKRDAAESLIMKIGSEKEFGNGFIMGSMMNWRAVINIVSPLIFARLYARYGGRGVFVAGGVAVLLAELALQTLSNDELGLDSNGQLLKKGAKQS